MESQDYLYLFITIWSVLVVVSVLLSAFISAAETAITAVNKYKIRDLSEKKHSKARILNQLLEHPGRVITTLLIGNNIVNIAASSVATALAIAYLGRYFDLALITTAVTVVMTIVIIIFGEIIPKNIAISNSERVSLMLASTINIVVKAMGPLASLLSNLSRVFIKMFGGPLPEKGSLLTADELRIMLKVSEEEGIIEEEEKEMIQGIFELGNSIVREIMTPRTDMACVEINATIEDVINTAFDSGHSRIPVYEERIDNVKGLIYIKDLLKVSNEEKLHGIRKYIREAYYIPETKKVDELLTKMRINKNHIAIVVDEYGGTSGVVSIEDILEEIVGDIKDEYDEEEPPLFKKINDYIYQFSAKISIWEANEVLAIKIPEGDDYDTLGGFLCGLVGEIPSKDRVIEWENLVFKVLDASKQQILKVQVEVNPQNELEDNEKVLAE